jgi:hypothetical protein
LPIWRGTESSNPFPSSGESSANPISWIMVGAQNRSLAVSKLGIAWAGAPACSQCAVSLAREVRKGARDWAGVDARELPPPRVVGGWEARWPIGGSWGYLLARPSKHPRKFLVYVSLPEAAWGREIHNAFESPGRPMGGKRWRDKLLTA